MRSDSTTRTLFVIQGSIKYKVSIEPVAFTDDRNGGSLPNTPLRGSSHQSLDKSFNRRQKYQLDSFLRDQNFEETILRTMPDFLQAPLSRDEVGNDLEWMNQLRERLVGMTETYSDRLDSLPTNALKQTLNDAADALDLGSDYKILV